MNPKSHDTPISVSSKPMSAVLDRGDIETTIPDRFDRIAAQLSSHLAIRDQEHSWTYKELQRRANQLAQAVLERSSVGAGCVAYLVPHSPEMVLCGLGILKAGKTSLCIHPSLPTAAQRDILSDACPDLLITCRSMESRAREIIEDRCGLFILEDMDDMAAELQANVPVQTGDAALIFYTSGSTGRPKGVVKSHRGVLHRAWLCAQYDHFRPADRHSLFTYCSFATTESDVYGTLLNGATLCLFDLATRGLADLSGWIDAEQVTVLHPPVMLFRRFLSTLKSENLFPSVRLVALAGETVVASDVESWRRHFSKSCALRHRFSSTEAGHLAVACIEPGVALDPGIVPPGKAVADKFLRVVDESGDEVAPGVVGELFVQSEYLAAGYWRRPAETAHAFAVDPRNPQLRTFRTGDLGRIDADGGFEFLGRRDHQVKIRGYRLELKEVESALLMLDTVQEAAVIVHRIDDESRLIAYVVYKPEYVFSTEELRAELRKTLPEWKVPTRFISLPSMPLTPTGKIDRQSLPPLDEPLSDGDFDFAEPGSLAEQKLADIWRDLLGRQHIGIHDNFFDVGGHSLLAAQLFARIADAFGRKLPMATLFQYGSIAQLAQLLSRPEPVSDIASILPLQPHGNGRPLFFFPALGGDLMFARNLIQELGRPFPMVGIQPALTLANIDQFREFQTTVRNYVSAIQACQPQGPYALVGYSYGGLVAYEAACVLTELGESVDRLIIVDWGPARRLRKLNRESLWRRNARVVTNFPGWLREEARHFSAIRLASNAYRKLKRLIRRFTSRSELPLELHDAYDINRFPTQNLEIMRAVYAAFQDHMPRRYAGQLTLIRAKTRGLLDDSPPDLHWNQFVPTLELRTMDGNHYSILHPPHVAQLARHLEEAMEGRVS
jgi:amino acid adenylation domain-containing protein